MREEYKIKNLNPRKNPYTGKIKQVLNMIDHAYDTVFNSFSKKVQKQILEEN